MKQVMWTKRIIGLFIEEAMLTDEEKEILTLRVKGYTIEEQAEVLNISISKVNRITRRLKLKYDELQKEKPHDLPKRKETTKDLYREA